MNERINRPKATTVLAVILVPLLVAGGFLWGTWNANPRLRTVQAAIVNNDEMVEINGQLMPLGRQLSAELVDSQREQNLTWVLADSRHAEAGLANGTYAAVVTIPKEFSAAATSFGKEADEAVQATIRVETSPVTGVSETALGKSIADAATASLNRFLTGEYLKNIYIGFNQMGDQFNDLKDGTRKLADGATLLSDGTRQASGGADKLADGLGQASGGGALLRAGGHQLADGTSELATGADALADGMGTYATGMRTYATGVQQYTDGVKGYVGVVNPLAVRVRDLVSQLPDWGDLIAKLDPIIDALSDWAGRIDPQVQRFVQDLKAFLDRVDTYIASGQAVSKSIDTYAQQMNDMPVACPADLKPTPGACDAFARGVAQTRTAASAKLVPVQKQADTLVVDGAAIHAWIVKIKAAADKLSSLSAEFGAWAPKVQAEWAAFKATLPTSTLTRTDALNLLDQFIDGGNKLVAGGDALSDGAAKLASGADALAGGATQLASGSRALSLGATGLASGIDKFTLGIDEAAGGARQLATGLVELDAGANELASGTRTLADGVAEGAGKIPHYSDAGRDNLAKVVSSPVDTDGLSDLVLPTLSWASLLLVMALWLGALATFAVFRAVAPRNLVSSSSNGRLLWRGVAPGLAIVAIQGLLLALLGAGVLGLDAATTAGVVVISLVAAAAFVAVNHALAAWFGAKGRVASLAFLLVTVVSALAYSAPGAFGVLKALSPLTPALEAIRMTMTGHLAILPALGLVAWLVAGLAASYLAVVRSRTTTLAALVA